MSAELQMTESAEPQYDVVFNVGPVTHMVKVPQSTCLLAFRGSIAHNMATISEPDSIDDIDLMGIVIGQPQHYLGLTDMWSRGTKEIKDGPYDTVLYDVKKMFGMLLNGNPNVMSLLWVKPEHYLLLTEAGKRIVDNRNLFAAKHLYHSFAGYASGQLIKAESRDPAELREYLAVTAECKYRGIHPNSNNVSEPYPVSCMDLYPGEMKNVAAHSNDVLRAKLAHYMKKGDNTGYMGDKRKQSVLKHSWDVKNGAHCVRLLRMIRDFFNSNGNMPVWREDAEELLEIKRGQWTLERVKAHAEELYRQVKEARDRSTLPDEPDRTSVERLLVSILQDELFNKKKGTFHVIA